MVDGGDDSREMLRRRIADTARGSARSPSLRGVARSRPLLAGTRPWAFVARAVPSVTTPIDVELQVLTGTATEGVDGGDVDEHAAAQDADTVGELLDLGHHL